MTRFHRCAAIAAPLVLTGTARAQPCAYLYENPAWYTARAPQSVRSVDLNGDGATDILSVGQLGEVAVTINEGEPPSDPALNPGVWVFLGSLPAGPVAGDPSWALPLNGPLEQLAFVATLSDESGEEGFRQSWISVIDLGF